MSEVSDLVRVAIDERWSLHALEERIARAGLNGAQVLRAMVQGLLEELERHAAVQRSAPRVTTLASRLFLDVSLRYTNEEGKRSRRKVTVHEIRGYHDPAAGTVITALYGFCWLRRRYRLFEIDGIEAMTDIATGAAIDDPRRWLLDCAGVSEPSLA